MSRGGQDPRGPAALHTDDIAWNHSRFGWADLLIEGILDPVRHGRAVSYRPPRWAEHDREGSIEVPADCPLLVIEGDGAGRKEVAHLLDALIWVQSDEREAGRRVHARIGKPNEAPTLWHHPEWMAEERPGPCQGPGLSRNARRHCDNGGGLCPAREPGGTLQGRMSSLPDVAWLASPTTDLAMDAQQPD